jgi:hypothetical protein
VNWSYVRQGLAVALVGVVGIVAVVKGGWLGGDSSPVLLVPWSLVIGGLWRAALGAITR